jgi:hypothetical protein
MGKDNNKKSGQGLLEAIIGLGILTSGFLAVLSLVIGNLVSERTGTMRLQALNLAREGIEAVKNIRDSNWLAGKTTWNGIIFGDNFEKRTFQLVFNPDNGSKILKSSPDDIEMAPLYLRDGFYLQGEGEGMKTQFWRLITITPIVCSEELKETDCLDLGSKKIIGIKIESKVKWREEGKEHFVTLTEKLYDWR